MTNNYYCSQKWWWLTFDPERRLLASCCKAEHQPIDISWLKDNPGQIFNNPTIVREREDMLAGKPVASCAKSCWIPESKGIPSRRIMFKEKSKREFNKTTSAPEVVEIILGSNCNMTCVYCSKRFSDAWLRDIKEQGTYIPGYKIEDRFDITIDDKVISKLGQAAIKTSDRYKTILQEVKYFGKLNVLKIAGGEPFLYNGLEDIVGSVDAGKIEIATGLGVNPKRFERLVQMLPPTTTLVVSAESIGPLYEFVRYGNTYDNFKKNLAILQKHDIKYKFGITISNLNVHGFKKFQDEYGTHNDYFNILVDPAYLSPSLIDDTSRDIILSTSYKYNQEEIHKAVSAGYTSEQLTHFRQFVIEFARRRNLSFDVFPESFTAWIQK